MMNGEQPEESPSQSGISLTSQDPAQATSVASSEQTNAELAKSSQVGNDSVNQFGIFLNYRLSVWTYNSVHYFLGESGS